MTDFRLGIHAPTQGATTRFHATAAALDAGAIVWLPSEQPSDSSRYPSALHVVRLDNWHAGEDPGSYAARVLPRIHQWIGVPQVVFQLGNEPDLEASHLGEDFPRYAARLHAMVPGIKLANPPLKAENTYRWNADQLSGADYLSCHCYWQLHAPYDIHNENLGAAYAHFEEMGRPIVVSEVNAVPTSGNAADTNVDWEERNRQVADWAYWATLDGVHACCIFIADAAPDWAGFDVGPESAADIRFRYEAHVADDEDEPPPAPPVGPPPPVTVALPWTFVQPCTAPIFQGSYGNFSHAGRSPGFYAIDYAPLPLDSPVYCVADGEVTYNGFNHPQEGQTGHTICVTHADGYESRYCHLNQYNPPVGAVVVQGEVIALSGAPDYPYPGANGFGSGPHLHFSILWWGHWVPVESLMERDEMAPIGVTGGRIAAAQEVDMLVETSFDDAELARLWDGPKTPAQKRDAPFNRDWGIPQAWIEQLCAGRPLGFAVSGEESDPASGRVVQYFTNGKITYFTADGTIAIN